MKEGRAKQGMTVKGQSSERNLETLRDGKGYESRSLEVVWETVDDPNEAEMLLQAFAMILMDPGCSQVPLDKRVPEVHELDKRHTGS